MSRIARILAIAALSLEAGAFTAIPALGGTLPNFHLQPEETVDDGSPDVNVPGTIDWRGICVSDFNDRWLVFGDLRWNGRFYRAILLHSEDQGQNWHEIPFPTSDYLSIFVAEMLSRDSWRFILDHEGDIPDDKISVLATDNAGKDWQWRAAIAKSTIHGEILSLQWQSEGVANLAMAEGSPSEAFKEVHHRSIDDGRSWEKIAADIQYRNNPFTFLQGFSSSIPVTQCWARAESENEVNLGFSVEAVTGEGGTTWVLDSYRSLHRMKQQITLPATWRLTGSPPRVVFSDP